jgi:hypothetical protein
MGKPLTTTDTVDSFVVKLRAWAGEIGHGSLEIEFRCEIHNGQIREIEHGDPKRRTKIRKN